MVFSSIIFLWVLLPCILLLYYVSPKPFKNGILTVFSLFFYAWGEPRYVVLMIFSVLLNYGFGRLVEKFGKKRWLLALCVTLNLLILGYFKYYNFLAEVLNPLLRGFDIALPAIQVTLPIGISFYTFQALSYVVDVYRGENQAQKNPLNMMLYISFFPQLIAGPIVKYHDIAQEIENRTQTVDGVMNGIRRFIAGLSKKVLISNTVGLVADTLFAADISGLNAAAAWIGAISYMLQIYFDFSGYSDMAIGLGEMFGFHFKENFNYPYISGSIREFWRRWHMSLSGWFQEYLYIPLGGNRKGKVRTVINKFIVFLCTGIWHGANVTFLFWGLYHGCFLMLEEFVPAIREKGGRVKSVFQHIYALLVVLIGFVFFRADTMSQGVAWVKTMFTGFGANPAAMSLTLEQLTPLYLVTLAVGIVACCPVKNLVKKSGAYEAVTAIGSLVLLALSMLSLASGTYNPFIYFRF